MPKKPKKKDMKTLRELGLLLALYRKRRGMTQALLAEKTNITASMISRIENGSANTTVVSILKICEALDVPVSQLFGDLEQHMN